jgi:hypothetical protein
MAAKKIVACVPMVYQGVTNWCKKCQFKKDAGRCADYRIEYRCVLVVE